MAAALLSQLVNLEDEVQSKLATSEKEFSNGEKAFQAAREKLYKRRQELVSGKVPPTAEELQGYELSHGEGHAAASSKGVPYFWLNVLCNQDTLAEEISNRDKQALSHCTSIKAMYSTVGGPPTIEMSFTSNPFFSNSTLRRRLEDEESGGKEVTTDIQWKDTAHKLTVKEVRKGGGGGKKSKKGGKGGKGADEGASSSNVRLKPCPSFFSFFLPASGSSNESKVAKHLHDPVALHDGQEDDEIEEAGEGSPAQSAKADRDALIMSLLLERVLPKAAELYMAGPLQSLSDEDSDDGDYQLVHTAVGSPGELPGPVQGILAALRHNQAALDALAAERAKEHAAADARRNRLRLELAEQRRSLLCSDGSSSSSALPRFWLRVLRSADAAALAISRRDAAVLANLADVRFSLSSAAEAGDSEEMHGTLELEFLPNSYLASSCSKLVKEYTFQLGPGGEPYLLHSKVTAAPSWATPQHDPTHKQGRDGKARPASSFFQLLRSGGGKYAFNLTGNDREVQAEANELEVELLMELHAHLMLRAGHIYDSLDADGWAEEDSAAGDQAAWAAAAEAEDSEDEEEVGTDDEGEAAHKAAARRAKQKAGGFKITKASVLVGLMALLLLAQLFVFLDMTGWFSSKR